MDNQQYEFNQSQNELIADLANKMRFVAYFSIIAGIVTIIAGFTSIRLGSINPILIIQGIVPLLVGFWTIKASSFFKSIVDTQDRDIVNLMGALGELRNLYGLQYWLLIISLVFMAIAFVLAIILGATGVGS